MAYVAYPNGGLMMNQYVNIQEDDGFENAQSMLNVHNFEHSDMDSSPAYPFSTTYPYEIKMDTHHSMQIPMFKTNMTTSTQHNPNLRAQDMLLYPGPSKMDSPDDIDQNDDQLTSPVSIRSMFDPRSQDMISETAPEHGSVDERTPKGEHSGDMEPLIPPAKRCRKSRAKEEQPSESNKDFVKRARFLERNRIAASKCRHKKKVWTTNLDETAKELQMSRDAWHRTAQSLKEEILYLKGEMLRHSGCHCPEITEYLQHQVGVFTGNGSNCSHCKHSSGDHTSSTQYTSPMSMDSTFSHESRDNDEVYNAPLPHFHDT